MEGIVFQKKELPDASLLLKVLLKDGSIQKTKIPGILKSNKRNGYFLSPGTLWDFTFSGTIKEVMIPREYSLIRSPFEINAGYRELVLLMEAMKLLNKLKEGVIIEGIFEKSRELVLNWITGNAIWQNHLINIFYLDFMNYSGLLHFSDYCIHCSNELDKSDLYHLFSGSTCKSCLNRIEYRREETLPNIWIKNILSIEKPDDKRLVPEGDLKNDEYRLRIFQFLEREI